MRFDILTLFPEIFDSFLGESLLKKGIDSGKIEVLRWNIRDWSTSKHHKVDDRPYGGGPGMVIKPDVVVDCVEAVQRQAPPGKLVLLTPAGQRLTQQSVEQLATYDRLLLLCGRYEGFDDRIRLELEPWEISVGDFICNGGEVPAMMIIETVMRLIPGVLGDEMSAREDSFSEPGWVEYPQYTRPPEFRGRTVPGVLLRGNHQEIAAWRRDQARRRSTDRQQQSRNESAGESSAET
ncbi:tRNA (guanosine(37)-N1)-methyltransferase TrmD [bacterium]|jgi:tRNA (guanine37-N1)-methyltransferase|nr:tRNA (guanosine(37)-N1)-methyltransferase TrmD [bacterium]